MCANLFRRTLGLTSPSTRSSYAPFDGLCVDVLDDILSHITWPADLRAAALVCHAWHARASTLLYATLPVLHSRPAQTLALLDQLDASPHRASLICTLVFESVHSKHTPSFSLARADELRQLAKRLARVLPRLRNLRSVRMGGGAHPLLMSAHASYPRFRGRCSYSALHLLGGEPSGTTWRALAAPALELDRVAARLWSRCAPPADALRDVRALVLRGAGFDDWAAARAWGPALAHLHRLEALLLVDLAADECALLAKAVMPRLRTLVLMNVRGPVCVPASVERLAVLGDCSWLYDGPVELPRLRQLRVVDRRPSASAHDFVSRQDCVEEFSFITRTPDDSAFVLRGTPFEGERIVCLNNRRSWLQRLRIR